MSNRASDVIDAAKRRRSLLLAVLLAATFSGNAAAELAIIVHPGYGGGEMTAEEVRDVFLGSYKRFPSGDVATPVDQPAGSADREAFLGAVLKMSEKEFKRHWSRLIFSGKGSPPQGLENADVVLRWVARNPDGIGYVDATLVDASVKVLFTVE